MKVLHLALKGELYPNNGVTESFKEMGMSVMEIDWQKMGFNAGLLGMWDRIYHICEDFKPDIIFCQIQRQGIMDIEEAQELSKYGKVVNYTFDINEDIQWYIDIAKEISLTLFGSLEDVLKCINSGIPEEKVDYLQSSFDQTIYDKKNITGYYGDIIFIGHNYANSNLNFPFSKERENLVNFMKENFSDNFRVYGSGWGSDSRILNPSEECIAYNSCKIAITQNQFIRRGYTSDRLFRATACGAFTISEWYPFIQNDFPEIEFWNNFDMLKDKCEWYLSHDNMRQAKAEDLYLHTTLNHRWTNRIKKVLSLLN